MIILSLMLWTACFLQGQAFISFEQFGAKGNGTDETSIILSAIKEAKDKKLPIRLMGGIYKFSPGSMVDITGIPRIEGNGTIDLSDTGPNKGNNSMTHVFTVNGKKQLLQQGIKIKKGEREVTLKQGLDLSADDILFITSAEPLPNPRRPYNCKGQRVKVKSYNPASGILMITDTFFFDIANAYTWKNTYMPQIEIGKDVRFVTSKMNFVGCLQVVYAKAIISGYYENFALAAISLRSSWGRFDNVKTNLPVTQNNGYSIGISIADMSEGFVTNCNLSGGRHNVSGTGGGLWRKSESGGPGEAAGYPSVLEINGGTYTGIKNVNGISEDNGTIDSHGNVYKMTVKNCIIYGGMNLGADYAFIDNVTVYTDSKRAFNFGSDVQPGSDWGHYRISNSKIIVDKGNIKSVMLTKSDVNEISLSHVSISGLDENSLLADFRYPGPKKLDISELVLTNHGELNKAPRFLINRNSTLVIDDISCIKENEIRKF